MTALNSRTTLPRNALQVCASCERPRGNVRKAWNAITRDGVVVGWTCPDCPTVGEPIRRWPTRGRVRFRVVVDVTPPGATKRQQFTRTLDSLDEARAVVQQVRADAAQGSHGPRKPQTLNEVAERWLDGRVDVREVTVEGYRGVLAPVLRRLGNRDVASLTPADMRELVAWLGKCGGRPTRDHPQGRPLGPRSVKGSLGGLAQVLDQAVSDGLVPTNVARGVKRPRQTRTLGRDLEHWQPSELLAFRDYADRHSLAAAWRLSLCGLTRADVLGLRWSDVDMAAGTVTVSQGRVQLHQGGQRTAVDDPKSAQRRRTVPVEVIHPGTIAALKALKVWQAADRLRAGEVYEDSGLVVVDALGRGVRPEWYSDEFRRLCKDAQVRVIRLHSVRHSLAFWLHSVGVSPADAAALLGHTVEVHLSTYLPDSGSAGIAAAAAALGRSSRAAVST